MMTVAKTIDVRISSVASRTTTARPAPPPAAGRVLAQPPDHVLDVDDRVVDERADGDGHAAERHRVDGGAEGAQHRARRGASDSGIAVSVIAAARRLARNSTTTTTSRAAVAQRGDDVVDRDLDEVGLPEDAPVDRHARRQLALQRVELAVEPRGHLDRVRARAASGRRR